MVSVSLDHVHVVILGDHADLLAADGDGRHGGEEAARAQALVSLLEGQEIASGSFLSP